MVVVTSSAVSVTELVLAAGGWSSVALLGALALGGVTGGAGGVDFRLRVNV